MNHTQTNEKKRKRKRDGRSRLSPFCMKAVALLRNLPTKKKTFSLYVTEDGYSKPFAILERGNAKSDSTYYVHLSPTGEMPPHLPPESTYVVRTTAEMESTLAMFADHPEMWSRKGGDALDGAIDVDALPENLLSYEEDWRIE